MADHLVDVTERFVREYRVDGYRWDSVSNIRALDGKGTVPGGRELVARANDATRKLLPEAILVAEDLKGDANVSAPTAAGGLGFGANWTRASAGLATPSSPTTTTRATCSACATRFL